jgi:hypothetical protein
MRDRLVEAKGEQVAGLRGDLEPRQEEHAVMPAFEPVPARLKRVVIGEQHRICLGIRRGLDDLRHRRISVRVRGMNMDNGGEVVGIPTRG